MTLFLSLLPIYIFGNLHCMGMCGPLVTLFAKRDDCWLYFLGRLISFSFMGLLSAEMGMLFFLFLDRYHISALFSLTFGSIILGVGICLLFRLRSPGGLWMSKLTTHLSNRLSRLIMNRSLFLFGLATILLPCGQTVVVFSACALNGNPIVGLINGFFFALFTSPALVAALYSFSLFHKAKRFYPMIMGLATSVVGFLALLRGFADLEWISHLVLNPNSPPSYHIVLF